MKLRITTGVAVAMSIVSVSARATTLPARGVNPQFSPFAKCIQKHHPGFPKDGSNPTPQETRDCIDQMQPKVRRAEALDDDVLLYEPEETDAVQARGVIDIIDTAQVLGKQLYLAKTPLCDGTQLHDNFVWVEDIVSQAGQVCSQLKEKIDAYNIKEDGGVATVVSLLTNGHDKQGHLLKDNRHVTATFLLSIYPPTNMAIADIKALAGGIYDLCNDGIMRIASKETGGCSDGIKYYRPSKGRSFGGAGAIGGILRMFYGADTSPVADLSMDFSNDS